MSDLQRHQHCYDYAEVEAERDRLQEEVLGLRGADIPVLKRENDRMVKALARAEEAFLEVEAERNRMVRKNSEAVLLVAKLRQEIEFLKGESPDVFIEQERDREYDPYADPFHGERNKE